MAAIGAILLILGASAMDSASLVIPAAMVTCGIMLIYVDERRKKWITSAR